MEGTLPEQLPHSSSSAPALKGTKGPDVPDNITVLASAVAAAKLGLVDQLSQAVSQCAAVIHAKDAESRTCLHYAAGYGHEECVSLLLEQNSDACVRDINGDLPLHFASIHGHPMCAYSITKACPSACLARNNRGQTPVEVAVACERGEVLNAMLLACAGDGSGGTTVQAMRKLLVSGAVPDTWAPNGSSALMLSAAANGTEALGVLLEAGATLELQDALGRSALMFAAGNSAKDTLVALLDAGASMSQRDRRGRNVLDYAPEGSEVRRLLQARLDELEAVAARLQEDLLASLAPEAKAAATAVGSKKKKQAAKKAQPCGVAKASCTGSAGDVLSCTAGKTKADDASPAEPAPSVPAVRSATGVKDPQECVASVRGWAAPAPASAASPPGACFASTTTAAPAAPSKPAPACDQQDDGVNAWQTVGSHKMRKHDADTHSDGGRGPPGLASGGSATSSHGGHGLSHSSSQAYARSSRPGSANGVPQGTAGAGGPGSAGTAAASKPAAAPKPPVPRCPASQPQATCKASVAVGAAQTAAAAASGKKQVVVLRACSGSSAAAAPDAAPSSGAIPHGACASSGGSAGFKAALLGKDTAQPAFAPPAAPVAAPAQAPVEGPSAAACGAPAAPPCPAAGSSACSDPRLDEQVAMPCGCTPCGAVGAQVIHTPSSLVQCGTAAAGARMAAAASAVSAPDRRPAWGLSQHCSGAHGAVRSGSGAGSTGPPSPRSYPPLSTANVACRSRAGAAAGDSVPPSVASVAESEGMSASSQTSTRSSHHGAGAACSPKSFGHHDVWMRPSPVDVLQETLAASACAAAATAALQDGAAAQAQPSAGAARCATSQHSKTNSATSSLLSFDGSVASSSTAGLPIPLAAAHGLDALLFNFSASPQKPTKSGLGLALHEHQQRPSHMQHSRLADVAGSDAFDVRAAGPLGTSPVACAPRASGLGAFASQGARASEAGSGFGTAAVEPGESSTVSAAGEVARLRAENAALQRRHRKAELRHNQELAAVLQDAEQHQAQMVERVLAQERLRITANLLAIGLCPEAILAVITPPGHGVDAQLLGSSACSAVANPLGAVPGTGAAAAEPAPGAGAVGVAPSAQAGGIGAGIGAGAQGKASSGAGDAAGACASAPRISGHGGAAAPNGAAGASSRAAQQAGSKGKGHGKGKQQSAKQQQPQAAPPQPGQQHNKADPVLSRVAPVAAPCPMPTAAPPYAAEALAKVTAGRAGSLCLPISLSPSPAVTPTAPARRSPAIPIPGTSAGGRVDMSNNTRAVTVGTAPAAPAALPMPRAPLLSTSAASVAASFGAAVGACCGPLSSPLSSSFGSHAGPVVGSLCGGLGLGLASSPLTRGGGFELSFGGIAFPSQQGKGLEQEEHGEDSGEGMDLPACGDISALLAMDDDF